LTVTVIALDGTTDKTYTINYDVAVGNTLKETKALAAGWKVVDGKLSVSGSEAYTVYSINGVTVAQITTNAAGATVSLPQGIYIVKTVDNQVLKIIVK
jgi:hypothetical protein